MKSALMLCDLSSMADGSTIVASFSRRQTLREPFNATSLLLTERKRKLFVYIDTQCRFMEGPKVRQWLWESTAELLLAFITRGGKRPTQRSQQCQQRAWVGQDVWVSQSLRGGFTTRNDVKRFYCSYSDNSCRVAEWWVTLCATNSQGFGESNPWILVTEHCGGASLPPCAELHIHTEDLLWNYISDLQKSTADHKRQKTAKLLWGVAMSAKCFSLYRAGFYGSTEPPS